MLIILPQLVKKKFVEAAAALPSSISEYKCVLVYFIF